MLALEFYWLHQWLSLVSSLNNADKTTSRCSLVAISIKATNNGKLRNTEIVMAAVTVVKYEADYNLNYVLLPPQSMI